MPVRGTLRNSLIFWFLLFSLVPLIFVTGFALEKSRVALDRELFQRITGNAKDVELTLNGFENHLVAKAEKYSVDRSLSFYLSNSNQSEIKRLVLEWLGSTVASRISILNSDGRIIASAYKTAEEKKVADDLEGPNQIFVAEEVLKKIKANPKAKLIESKKESLELIQYYPVFSKSGKGMGYIEQVLSFQKNFLSSFKARLNVDVSLMSPDYKIVSSTNEDLLSYPQRFFQSLKGDFVGKLFDIKVRSLPYGILVHPIAWGDSKFFILLAAAKIEANDTLRNIKTAFIGVFLTVLVLVVILTWVTSNVVVRPLRDLYAGITRLNSGEEGISLPVHGDNEMSYLSQSFNEMSLRIKEARDDLRKKIQELESANNEIRKSQSHLVHSAKMASLGQLVAGIAHELNNPIGFIYSNLTQLDDYSKRLVKIIGLALTNAGDLEKTMKTEDFEYIKNDLPKLIKSCQDGARRTRDIVLGLRNFSRLEEANLKEADINESIDDTLMLLSGELKGRIQVSKKYGKLPLVPCYIGNLNQVFMNILSNAVQAIEGNGNIEISTAIESKSKEDWINILIKDDGKGMSKETSEKIFDPFFTTKNVGQGTGLGMSISYGIVQKHGGNILVKSQPGKGSEFTIQIPALGPPDARAKEIRIKQ
ncbi:MAG: ATP-binding protein [Pseudomonadota bacterium]|nr:ATP-binding protein [Pseudomonadota bacterium]